MSQNGWNKKRILWGDKLTNYEKIKTMNLEELGYFLSDIQWDSNEPTGQEMIAWSLEECEDVD